MKKIIVLLLAIALLCTGCATSGDTSAPAADPAVAEDGSTAPATGGESKKIFFMVKNLTNPSLCKWPTRPPPNVRSTAGSARF